MKRRTHKKRESIRERVRLRCRKRRNGNVQALWFAATFEQIFRVNRHPPARPTARLTYATYVPEDTEVGFLDPVSGDYIITTVAQLMGEP